VLLNDLKSKVNAYIIDFLWNQWSQLGVAGNTITRNEWIIDPEALILFSLNCARYDSRLFDEIIDWMIVNERWISLQRIKSLKKQYNNEQTASIFAAIASTINKRKSNIRWEAFSKFKLETDTQMKPLFLNHDGTIMPLLGEPDANFKSAGWLRSEINPRRLSIQIPFSTPSNLILHLRSLFGLSPKAEIIAYLMSNNRTNVSDLVTATGYTRPPIHESLNDLLAGGYINTKKLKSGQIYSLNTERWKQFIGINHKSSIWIDWQSVFISIDKLIAFFEAAQTDKMSEYLLKSELISIAEILNNGIASSGLPNPFSHGFTLDNVISDFPKQIDEFFNDVLI
jgi:hypothetical protein